MYTRGMGEYPGAVCYDATRWGIIPYWYDTTPELLCKAKFYTGSAPPAFTSLTPPMPTGPAVPGGDPASLLTGAPQAIIDSTIDPSAAQDRLNIKNFFAGVNAGLQVDPSAGVPDPNAPPDYTKLALLGVGAIALLALLRR